jgi:hypothetical protein
MWAVQVFTRGHVGSRGVAEVAQIPTLPDPTEEGGCCRISSVMLGLEDVQPATAHRASRQTRRRMPDSSDPVVRIEGI